jgi:tetratricopeptide (TPR) repeat protein
VSGAPDRTAGKLEREIEAALKPGRYVSERASLSFVDSLWKVGTRVAELVQSAPELAVDLYQAFLAGCHEKAEEVDDSGGCFGDFAGALACGWVTARQAAGGATADQTVTRLLAWMDDDQYGFFHRLETKVADVLDEAGLAEFTDRIRVRFDAASQAAAISGDRSDQGHARSWAEALRTLYTAQGDVEAYAGLTEQTSLSAGDCHRLATMLDRLGEPARALSWVERGFEIDSQAPSGSFARLELAELKPRLLHKLGREDEAVELAWAAFGKHPGRYTYDNLMELVPEADRDTWHERAIQAAMGGTDLDQLVHLLLRTREIGRLAELVRASADEALQACHQAGPAAQELEPEYADQAARLWRAAGMRILTDRRSRRYATALRHFANARRCYERAELSADWQRLADDVHANATTSFLDRFEQLVTGSGPGPRPSFLDRAKARWATPDSD